MIFYSFASKFQIIALLYAAQRKDARRRVMQYYLNVILAKHMITFGNNLLAHGKERPFQIPDTGTITGKELVNFKPPEGESFKELCERVHPVIKQFCVSSKTQKITFFVHAGVIRAALALAFGSHISALKCEIDTLSATSIRHLGTNNFSVVSINKSAIT